MTNWRRYISRRLLLVAFTLFGVITAVFMLTHILPGNPALVRAGQFADAQTIKALEAEMGLDKPMIVQYTTYLGKLARGDLGDSHTTGRGVNQDLKQRLPATLELTLLSFAFAIIVGIPVGILAALKRGGWADKLCHAFVVGGGAIPVFWLALILIYLFYFKYHLVGAPSGRLDTFMDPPKALTGFYTVDSLLTGNWATFRAALSHLVLPAASMAMVALAPVTKVTRAAMRQVLGAEYILAARAMGIPQNKVARRDALRNALVPIVTMIGLVLGHLMAASVLVERIFAWPGIGLYGWNALMANDFDAVQGFVLVIGVSYVLINLAIDLLYSVIDPRIRLG